MSGLRRVEFARGRGRDPRLRASAHSGCSIRQSHANRSNSITNRATYQNRDFRVRLGARRRDRARFPRSYRRRPGNWQVDVALAVVSGDRSSGQAAYFTSLARSRPHRLKLRAERLATTHSELYVLAETDLDAALMAVEKLEPEFLIIDSIQTVFRPDLSSAPGSVAQVRECTALLLRWQRP